MNKEEILKNFTPQKTSERLKKLRCEANMSVMQLAEEVYLSRDAIYKMESAKNFPKIDTAVLFCAIYDTSLDYIYLGIEV